MVVFHTRRTEAHSIFRYACWLEALGLHFTSLHEVYTSVCLDNSPPLWYYHSYTSVALFSFRSDVSVVHPLPRHPVAYRHLQTKTGSWYGSGRDSTLSAMCSAHFLATPHPAITVHSFVRYQYEYHLSEHKLSNVHCIEEENPTKFS
jgi:hypothetical protein